MHRLHLEHLIPARRATAARGASLGIVLVAGLALTGCGSEESESAAPSTAIQRNPTRTFETTAPTPTPADTPPPLPEREPRTELKNGLVIEVVEAGEGRRAARVGDRLSIHYDARLAEDESALVESSHAAGIPFRLRLGDGDVVRGLERGLSGAREGDLLRLFVPSALGYGERAVGAVPAGADLIFEVRLLRIAE